MTTVPQTRTDLLAARKAAAGTFHFVAGYAGAVAAAGFAAAGAANAGVADATGAAAAGDALATLSGNIAPISWHTSKWSRNLVAPVVMPAA